MQWCRGHEACQDELIDAYKWGEEERARALIFQLGDKPNDIRAELEAMLEDSYGLARQAAAFGLGELGGAASVRRLDQQLLVEEARGDYDGEAVVEAIVEALGRIEEPGARESLVRRLERLPDAWISPFLAFITAAQNMRAEAVSQRHRPADPTFAKVFDEAAQALRSLH